MKKIKTFLAKKFETFYFAFKYLRYKIFICLALSVFAGVLDGFGLAMFLPLLQIATGDEVGRDGLGKLQFLVDGIKDLGFELNLMSVFSFMILFFVIKGFFTYLASAYRIILQQTFVKKIRVNLLDALNNISFKAFMNSDVGQIQNTMSGEVDCITNGFVQYLIALQNGIVVFVYMFFAFTIEYGFAVIVCIGGVLTNLLFTLLYKKTKKMSRTLTNYNNIYQGQIIQHVGFFKYLKATNYLKDFEKKLKNSINNIEGNRKKMGLLNSIMLGVREPVLIIVIALSIFIQVNFFGGTLSALLISLIFFYRALNSVSLMQTAWNVYLSTVGSFENIKKLQQDFDNKQEKENAKHVDIPRNIENLSLENVELTLGNNKVINRLNLNIEAKTTVAFIGESGSGKSTLINLIAGLLPPDIGELKINGLPYTKLNIAQLQDKIGYITQEPIIFNDSIYNNITLWKPKTKDNIARFEEVLRKASIKEFINTLEKKEDTLMGNSGITLSGGQKQRVSIARELFKDIEILIMDEATSALDTETEKEIQKNIDALKGFYTILIVAHRISTIQHADKIVLLKKGSIEDQGNFKELYGSNNNFKKQVSNQNL